MNDTDLQLQAKEKLSKLKCGALFMEMGTGKTKVALDIINSKLNKIDIVLWICPYSLKDEIEKECTKWGFSSEKLHVIGCESIGSSQKIYFKILELIKDKRIFCVVDESLKIKNAKAKRTQRILEIGTLSKYRLILNGTPTSRNIIDLFTQMSFLSPLILSMTYFEFCKRYVVYSNTHPKYIRGYQNIDHLIMLIEPYIFDCKLSLDVKKKYHEYFYYNDFSEEYEKIKDEILNRVQTEVSDLDFYELCSRLQRCYTKSKSKQDLVNELVEKINDKVIVFVKYLSSVPASEISITGYNKISERKEILERFKNNEFKVLYMTYGVGSFGLNLQYVNNIIFAEHVFDYAQKIQAEHRIFRLGQENNQVNYYDVLCHCGLERIISDCIGKKENLLNRIKRELVKIEDLKKEL